MSVEHVAELPSPAERTGLWLRGGPVAVLLLHGLASAPAELLFLARGLHRAGYTVRVPVIEGYSFGTPATPRAEADWVQAALAEFDTLRGECREVAVGGLCIGAVLALRVAALRGPLVRAVLALSTTLHYDGWATPWYRRFLPLAAWVPLAGRIGVRETEPFGVKDERMRAWIRGQMASGMSDAGAAVLRVASLLAARRLIARVRQSLPDIEAPLLVLHAREDDAASTRSAFEVAARVRSAQVQLVLLADCYHMISIDREKHHVLAHMKDFLARRPGAGDGHSTTDNLIRLDTTRTHRNRP